MDTSKNVETQKAWLLLMAALICWGVNWPLMKIGLADIGPLWFAAIRIFSASIVLFIFLSVRGELHVPEKREFPALISVGVFQLGIFMALIHSAVLYVEAGRSAVLTYTTPIWTVPLAFWILKERLTRPQLTGVIFAAIGLLALFNPITFDWSNSGYLFGNGLLISAALVLSGVIIHVRSFGWSRPHLGLLPWQLLSGSCILIPIAFIIEGPLEGNLTPQIIWIMAFNSVAATAFGFWAYLAAVRVLPANTTAMTSLTVPVVGILASWLFLGETMSIELITGLSLIIIGQIIFHSQR